jgi:GNAT superfamily N-acetyltransferase
LVLTRKVLLFRFAQLQFSNTSYLKEGMTLTIGSCTPEAYQSTLDMLHLVYASAFGLPPLLDVHHPLLLGKTNLKNMRLAYEEERPVAAFNFYETTYLFEGVPMRIASVGCVGTDEAYRGRDYASRLMDDAEETMRSHGVLLEIISGARSLYTRKGAAGGAQWARVDIPVGPPVEGGARWEKYSFEHLDDILRLYAQEPSRFMRTRTEWEHILSGALMDWGGGHTQLLCAKNAAKLMAYAVVQYSEKEEFATVREFAGDRDVLLHALPDVGTMLSKTHVRCFAALGDPLIEKACRMGLPAAPCAWMGTIKILDCDSFMRTLRPYFLQYLSGEQTDLLRLSREENGYRLTMGEDSLAFDDGTTLHGMLFGKAARNHDASSGLIRACQKVFPLPLAWPENLNCQ